MGDWGDAALAFREGTTGKDLSDVDDSNRFLFPADDPVEMHQATHIGRGNELGPGIDMIGDSISSHHRRHLRFIDRKRPAKATALIIPSRSAPLDITDQIHHRANLVNSWNHRFTRCAKPQFAQPVAALVERDSVGKAGIEMIDFKFVMQVLTEFEAASGDVPVRHILRVEKLRIMVADHRRA